MYHAFIAVPADNQYMDVLEDKLGPEKWETLKEALQVAADTGYSPNYLILDFPDGEGNTTDVLLSLDDIEDLFHTTLGPDEGTFWIITKKQYANVFKPKFNRNR